MGVVHPRRGEYMGSTNTGIGLRNRILGAGRNVMVLLGISHGLSREALPILARVLFLDTATAASYGTCRCSMNPTAYAVIPDASGEPCLQVSGLRTRSRKPADAQGSLGLAP